MPAHSARCPSTAIVVGPAAPLPGPKRSCDPTGRTTGSTRERCAAEADEHRSPAVVPEQPSAQECADCQADDCTEHNGPHRSRAMPRLHVRGEQFRCGRIRDGFARAHEQAERKQHHEAGGQTSEHGSDRPDAEAGDETRSAPMRSANHPMKGCMGA